jgi:hypothetical protein
MLSSKSEASAAAAAGPAGVAAVAAPSPSPAPAPAPLSAGQRVEQHILSAVHQLWKSALIVEQGVATPVGAAVDPALERLMGMAQPRITTADLTNQNLQRQMSADRAQRCTDEMAMQLPALTRQQCDGRCSLLLCLPSPPAAVRSSLCDRSQ